MEPFYFESNGEQLFAVYHPAQDAFSQKAILICPPIYAEYFRTYRFLRNLANAWSLSGYHVMRFDYSGTGDSSGDWADAGPTRWLGDIEAATAELKDISGCTQIDLAGARFGATLALLSACNSKATNRVVIWDPVINGREYVASLLRTHARLLGKSDQRTRERLAKLPSELAGFRREAWIDSELQQVDLMAMRACDISSVEYVASGKANLDRKLIDALASKGVDIRENVYVDDCDWGTPSESAIQAFNIYEGLQRAIDP